MKTQDHLFNRFYMDKRVLVTGHTGFKGSWLSLWLLKLGAKVAGFSAYLPSKPCHFEVLGLRKMVEHHEGDVRDFQDLWRIFIDFQPQVVFHLAAQPIVRRSYDEPKLTFDTNLGGTVNLLECIRRTDFVQVAIIITSDKCYRNVEWIWGYRENDELGGDDPYSASKGCAEMAINSYAKAYFNNQKGCTIASTRAGNVVGGGDWAEDRIVPDCVRAWAKGHKVIVRNSRATRPWQHVLEPLSGYLWLGVLLRSKEVQSGEAFNFGPMTDVIKPVAELISSLATFWNGAKWKYRFEKHNKRESTLLKLCCDKVMAMLQWRPILSFNETVELTGSWYKKFYDDENMYDFSGLQIEHYCSLAEKQSVAWAKKN